MFRFVDSVLVITNADAGTADDEALAGALDLLREHTSVEVAATANPGELDSVLQRAGTRTIVVAGGDGSLHAVIAQLHKRNELNDKTIGLLPLGTGNDFARGNDIPLDIHEAAELLMSGEARPVDLIVDEVGGVVVNNVHIGAGAQASRRGARWKHRLGSLGVGKVNLGKLGYPLGTIQAAFLPPHIRLDIEIDGEQVNDLAQKVLMVSLGNGSHVGGGTPLAPDADTEDGLIDVVISRAVEPWRKFRYTWQLRKGDHTDRDDVLNLRGGKVTISGDEFWASADGEIYGPERSRSWRVERAAYRFIFPPETA